MNVQLPAGADLKFVLNIVAADVRRLKLQNRRLEIGPVK
jgi:hypothetical protein